MKNVNYIRICIVKCTIIHTYINGRIGKKAFMKDIVDDSKL